MDDMGDEAAEVVTILCENVYSDIAMKYDEQQQLQLACLVS